MHHPGWTVGFASALMSVASTVMAEDAGDLSKKLANPVAHMVSVPVQGNFDFGGGLHSNGAASTTNFQPVIPVSLTDDWSVIVRTILPVIGRDRFGPVADGFGVGDVVQSFFLSPKSNGGLIWGIGPVFLWPTATGNRFGTGKWGAGPTGVALWQQGPWTIGALANHIWSYAGPHGRRDVSATLLQPFVSYQFGHGLSASINTEATYDWVAREWSVPVNVGVAQVMKIGNQPLSLALGFKYFAVRPADASRWGIRTTLTFLFSKD